MVPAQVSSHLSGAFDGHHRPYVVNLKLCHDLWDDFFVVLGQGGPRKSVGPGIFGTFSEMGGKMLPKWQSYTGYRSLSKQRVKYVSYTPGN